MLRSIHVTCLTAICGLALAAPAMADEPATPVTATPLIGHALTQAWQGPLATPPQATVVQARRSARSAGPNIGAVGLGGVAGLSEFEIGPSFRYWINERFGVQAHLGFSGDNDFVGEDVEYLRFEPTFIVAIGDFGNADVNIRPYAGGGLRIFRTDIGDFDDVMIRPAGVGGVEFGFRGAPRLKVSAELSVSGENDLDDFNFGNGPSVGGVRAAALVHYFFD